MDDRARGEAARKFIRNFFLRGPGGGEVTVLSKRRRQCGLRGVGKFLAQFGRERLRSGHVSRSDKFAQSRI